MALSRTVTERRQRRLNRKNGLSPDGMPGTSDAGAIPQEQIPHAAVTDPPSATATHAMAQGGESVVRGNSNQDPMTPAGHAKIQQVGQELANIGGPSEIVPSTSRRTMESAQDISQQTGAPISQPQPGLESHALGQLEGEKKTGDVKKFLADMIRKYPNLKIPGQGALSNRPGESFNEFRSRALGAVKGLMQKLASNPTEKIVVPTSTQVIKLVKAWAAAGCPDDLSIDHRPMLKEDSGAPGEMERFFPDQQGSWEMTPFAPKSATEFQPGIYFLRHGETASVQASGVNGSQRARAEIVSHIRSGDYRSARKAAQSGSVAGLPDDEIESAIEEALPTAQDAENLPPDQLLAAVSAAGPNKRKELLPVAQRRFGDLSQISPEGQQALRTHLGRLRA